MPTPCASALRAPSIASRLNCASTTNSISFPRSAWERTTATLRVATPDRPHEPYTLPHLRIQAALPHLHHRSLASHFHPPRHRANHPGLLAFSPTNSPSHDLRLCHPGKSPALDCLGRRLEQ